MTKKLSPTSYFKDYLFENPDLVSKKKRIKIRMDEFVIPTFNEHNLILTNSYNVSQLKSMARFYKLKVSGNKMELIKRVWNYLKFSYYTTQLQKIWRGYIVRDYNSITGRFMDKSKCINQTDFLSLNDLSEIPDFQFFSFKDEDGFIYGFDAMSFHNLIEKNKEPYNPYNRKVLDKNIINLFGKFIRYSLLFKKNVKIVMPKETDMLSEEKKIEMHAYEIFQKIDSFGHITNAQWFLQLERVKLVKLLRELLDIWNYRASLTNQTKRAIYPPNGDPFRHINYHSINTSNKIQLQIKSLKLFDKLITSGIDDNSKSLGAFYILGALTLVNQNASAALPWLYESVYYSTNNTN
jgi:hypothetical protein